jgi:hypothetical protein
MVSGDIHACRNRATSVASRVREENATTRFERGPETRNNRWRLAEDGSIALAMSLAAMGGCYARHWWRGDVLRKDVSWLHFKKEVR